jgi:hypothetical protein
MDKLEAEAIRLGALLLSSEGWSDEYIKAPDEHARLLRKESKLHIDLHKFYKRMAANAQQFVNWYNYNYQIKADYQVEVIVNDNEINSWNDEFIKVSFQTVGELIAVGAAAGEVIYKIPLGIQSTDAIIQQLTTKEVAALVGKRVLKDGSIIDNPRAEYNVTETVRKDISQSIKNSLALGDDIQTATARLQNVIANPVRAERIAATEAVNAYQAGITEFGHQSGAVGKEWLDAGAVDVCAEYAGLGPVPFDYKYGGRLDGPAAHTRCRCGRRLIYAEEWARLQLK